MSRESRIGRKGKTQDLTPPFFALTDDNIVWRTIQTDIPRLRANVDALLDEMGKSQ